MNVFHKGRAISEVSLIISMGFKQCSSNKIR